MQTSIMLEIVFLAEAILLGIALLGHGALWVAFVNHLNATGIHYRVVSVVSKMSFLCFMGWLAWLAYWVVYDGGYRVVADRNWREVPLWMSFYFFSCMLIAIGPLPWYMMQRFPHRCFKLFRSRKSEIIDIAKRLGRRPVAGRLVRTLAVVPFNQLWQLEVNEKEIELPRLSESLDGLSIAHLSDLHFTGSVTKDYFEEVVRLTNRMQADLVAVTGDIFDDLRLAAWLPDTLGKLESRYGSYFILGNHDHAVGATQARSALTDAGLIDLSTGPRSLDIDGNRVVLAGSEHPWGTFPTLTGELDVDNPAPSSTLRVLLAHTPDNFSFARRCHFDLMLAGHSHGGQIRLPWIGPIVCPLRGGIKYAADTFHEPPTLMHVSRGISSQLPIRLNCRPELIKLVFRCPKTTASSAEEPFEREM